MNIGFGNGNNNTKIPNLFVQKDVSPKSGEEFCKKAIGVIRRCSISSSKANNDMQRRLKVPVVDGWVVVVVGVLKGI